MSNADQAARTVAKASTDLQATLEHGPEPRQLRQVVDDLYDACAMIMQLAGDIEAGLVD